MLNHLKLKHPSDFSETPDKAKQSSMNEFVNSPRSRRFSSSQSELIINAIIDMIVLDYLPLCIVEGRGFTKLMKIIAPEFKIPSRNTIKSRIEKVYCDKKGKLITELDQIEYVSLTTDTWTSNSTISFITVTDHHIDHKWDLQTNVLVTREMPDRHTGENLADKLNPRFPNLGRMVKL